MKTSEGRKAEHSPTPWKTATQMGQPAIEMRKGLLALLQGDRNDLVERETNAAFIVKAVNSHSALVEALKAFDFQATGLDTGSGLERFAKAKQQARAALRLAGGV